MRSSDFQREENFNDYLRLLRNNDYEQVMFDEKSGGVSAVHKGHRLDKQPGLNGERRGNYELRTVETFRQYGHSIVLLNESEVIGVKQYDGLLDGAPCEIKAVEQMGRWTVRTKIANAVKQGAVHVILFFPDPGLFSEERVQDGWKDWITHAKPSEQPVPEIQMFCVVNGTIRLIEKPSW
ncbi:MAG: hypothetical protein IJ222_09870 [Bacteroidales bacterium]|nr:hypothetical protein [Bacteroidales bacterium]